MYIVLEFEDLNKSVRIFSTIEEAKEWQKLLFRLYLENSTFTIEKLADIFGDFIYKYKHFFDTTSGNIKLRLRQVNYLIENSQNKNPENKVSGIFSIGKPINE